MEILSFLEQSCSYVTQFLRLLSAVRYAIGDVTILFSLSPFLYLDLYVLVDDALIS